MARNPGPATRRARPAGEQRATMADVARRAEVSTATVSYYLSGRSELVKRVGPQTRQRIREAIAELDYVQNKTARQLRRQSIERVCVLLPQLGIPFADKMAQDVQAAAEARGFSSIVMACPTAVSMRHALREVEAGLADGVIADADHLTAEELHDLFEPFTRIDKACLVMHPTVEPGPFSVLAHGRSAAFTSALEHVRGRGYRHIAYIRNTLEWENLRSQALRDFADAHADIAPPVIVAGARSREATVESVRDLLKLTPRPRVIMVESDFAAVSAIQEIQRAGLSVPGDVAVIGCGNIEEGFFCQPRLTTIGPESMSLTNAAEHLLDLIENKDTPAPRKSHVPWSLIVRESC